MNRQTRIPGTKYTPDPSLQRAAAISQGQVRISQPVVDARFARQAGEGGLEAGQGLLPFSLTDGFLADFQGQCVAVGRVAHRRCSAGWLAANSRPSSSR